MAFITSLRYPSTLPSPPPHPSDSCWSLQMLKGSVGLLFTNKSKEEVVQWFGSFSSEDFARSGFVASTRVELDEGRRGFNGRGLK